MLFVEWLKEEGSENVDWSIEDFMNFKYTPVGYMPWFMSFTTRLKKAIWIARRPSLKPLIVQKRTRG